MEVLSGYKTYLVAAGIICTALAAFAGGEADLVQTAVVILNGLGLGALRAGVEKAGS